MAPKQLSNAQKRKRKRQVEAVKMSQAGVLHKFLNKPLVEEPKGLFFSAHSEHLNPQDRHCASSSSSTTTVSYSYDVFMSFRGEDTRMHFISHLYKGLTQNHIITYKDDKALEIGRPIASELLEAIEASRTAVVVLSSNFATSKWCLEEIAKIVDCMKRGKLIVIPIFYHVSPSDVRHQSNCFEKGFADHEANPEIAAQKVEIWRAAFKEVGALSGLHVTEHSVEADVVTELVSKILMCLPDPMPTDLPNNLVGIESRVDEVKRILRMESSEVLFIGIYGMSGIGKTTLAEAVYKDINNKFEKSSLIENIKDISKQNDSTNLCKLQKKLIDDILMEKSIRVPNVIDGQTLLRTKLHRLKVLIVLDDVNHVDQLTYLAGGLDWFGNGSRIIVTTTNRDLLNRHKINETYLCKEMTGDEALSLFCQSAFEQRYPLHGYEKLSDDIVKLAGGLPLALNVYGSLLCGMDENYWKDMLKKLKKYPEEEVLGRLEVVYARLDKNQRCVFIYIACFLKGRNKDLVKDILTDIGLAPECGITDLMNKCLITINPDDTVWMHDLLQQMCWEILSKESHRYDGKHIAIKYHEDIVDVLSSNLQGTHTVEVINLEPYKGDVNDHFNDPMCFSKITKLKFLRISNVHFPEGLNYLSNSLRILEWYGCSLKFFPPMFEPKHIYELEMCSSQLKTLWKKDLKLPNMRSVNLSFSKDLTDIPNLTSASNLVKLNLEGCTNLTSLHESVLFLKRLRYLNLKYCTCLQSLGRNRMEMEALEVLILSGCSKLEYIPEFGMNMKRLEHLYVDGTRIKKLPENLGGVCGLRNLDASRTFIEELPSSIYCLKKLRLLHANGCRMSFKAGCFLNPSLDTLSSRLKEVDLSYCNLSVVPDGIGLLCHLITLDLSGNEFVLLPASIGLLSKLRVLCLNNCNRLRSLPKLSLADVDMDYEPRSRFNYCVSAGGVDASKFHASSYNNRPTVSCLNCPKLAMDKRGSYLAEKILNNYLALRTKYWLTPEAVFEVVGAGSEIPSGFMDPGDGGLIMEGPWIGVAICAVISVQHVDGYMGTNHMVTAFIHLGGKRWKIPVPINLLMVGSETQIILYWTIVDDCQRIALSSNWGKFDVSFSSKVTKVGVQFIREEYMMRLKLPEDSKIRVGTGVHKSIRFTYKPYIDACEEDTNLHHHTLKMVNFIINYGSQQDSLDSIYQITKGLLEINQELFSVLSEREIEWWNEDYLYCYYVMSLGTSVLYKDFIESVKGINDEWLGVKLGLDQIVLKSRADNYTYEEMLQHLNDLEAARSVELSDNFIKMFLSVCRITFEFLRSITIQLSKKPRFLREEILRRNLGFLREKTLRRELLENILPEMLHENILPEMLRENLLQEMLRDNLLSEMLQDNLLQEVLRENLLPENLRENLLPEILQENLLPERLQEDLITARCREDLIPEIHQQNLLPARLQENLSQEMLRENLLAKLQENLLQEMLRENLLPEWLRKITLLKMLRENIFPEWLRENILPERLQENILPGMLQENILLRENILPGMLQVNMLRRMLPKHLKLPGYIQSMLSMSMLRIYNPRYLSQRMLKEELAKISSIPVAGVICMMVVFMGNFKCLKEMKETTLSSLWQHLFEAISSVGNNFTEGGWFKMKTHYNHSLQISYFSENGILLQQLMNKMGRSSCFTEEHDKEMTSVIDKLQKNIRKVSSTIQEMSSHVEQYSRSIEDARTQVKDNSRFSKEIINMLQLFNKN